MKTNKVEKVLKNGIVWLFTAIAFVASILSIMYLNGAKSLGTEMGIQSGNIAGNAIGTIEGITIGRKEGLEAGKNAGLSAEDTSAKIANKISNMEKLEVLVASVKLKDFHEIGDDYAALYLANGNVVYTIDMSEAVVEQKDNEIYINIPKPEAELYINDSSIQKAAEYQKHFFSGSTEAGFDAYINSMKQLHTVSEKTLSNYDALIKSAEEAAVKQIKQLATSVGTSSKTIYVGFQKDE